jgi:peroxiredoxin
MDLHCLLSDWLRTTSPVAAPTPANRTLPSFLLPDDEGWLVSSEALQARGPYVLTFFHGSWCPACVRTLQFFDAELDRIYARGADMVACSPETSGFLRRMRAEKGLRFHLVSDVDCALSIDLGLAFALPDQVRRQLIESQIDLPARHGDGRWLLPIHVTMIIDRHGQIADAFTDCEKTHVGHVITALENVPPGCGPHTP